MNRNTISVLLLLFLITVSCTKKRYKDALTPEQELESFDLDKDFTAELFAAEPQITNPVEMVFDEFGGIYLVEMPDYPYKPDEGKGTGRIRKLIDSDGDGKIDQSVVFADSLSEATSILPYQGGLLVTAAPDIFYMKDTTGDFRADLKEVIFTGFFKNNSETQITSLRYGIDNWIYASNHGQAGEITFQRKPDAPSISVKGGDFRFRLDRGLFEVETGPAQFGQTLNDWNHRFVTQNTLYIQQSVIPWRYIHRHENLPVTRGVKNVGDPEGIMFQRTPPPYWRAERTRRRQEQYAEQKLDRKEYAEGHFTGASGGTHYGGHAFPEGYYGSIFTGDVAGNLVHRSVMKQYADSVFYQAQRAGSDKSREFLASEDPWFRPVNFSVGPDGNLYILDMYHQHIETPVSIPEDLQTDMDFDNGKQYGRIWRIVPKNAKAREKLTADLSGMTSQQYVQMLTHPNQWNRIQAQRLLVERQDKTAVASLIELCKTHQDPRTRLHALYTLEGMDALDAELVKLALNDAHAGVREHGVILAERYASLLPLLLEKTKDSSARVVMQATLSLGQFPSGNILPALAEVTDKHVSDPWFRMAVLSSETGSSLRFFEYLVKEKSFLKNNKGGTKKFVEEFAYTISSAGRKGEMSRLLALTSQSGTAWPLPVLKGMAKYLKKTDHKKPDAELIETLKKMKGADTETAAVLNEIHAAL
jgi:putative membrane-bound dehydrogenase-like protein